MTSVPLNVSSTNTVCGRYMEADDGMVDWLCPKFLVVFNIVGMSDGQTSFLNYRLHALIIALVLLTLNQFNHFLVNNFYKNTVLIIG